MKNARYLYPLKRKEHIRILLKFLATTGAPLVDTEKERLDELARLYQETGALSEGSYRRLVDIYDRYS